MGAAGIGQAEAKHARPLRRYIQLVSPRRLSLAALAAALSLGALPAHGAASFSDSMAEPIEATLITNEYAHWNPGLGVESPDWEMTSGSLFAGGWTGVPDDCAPNRLSSDCTNSAVFRLNTRRFDFGAVRVDAQLRGNAWASTSTTPAEAWDGVHLWLRYRSEESLYYASVARRDGAVVVKKKCPGGPSNGGTYYTLRSRSGVPLPLGEWRAVGASIDTAGDGSVVIDVFRDGARVLSAVDTGTGCAPILEPGAVGVRGDNLDFNVRDFTVTDLHPAAAPEEPPASEETQAPPAPSPIPAPPLPAPPRPAGPPAPAPPPPGVAPPVPAPPPGPAGAAAGASEVARPAARLVVRPAARRFRRSLRVRVSASRSVRRVTLHLGRRRVGTDRSSPFSMRVRPPSRLRRGAHRLRATAYDGRGRRLATRTVRVRYLGGRR